MNYLFTGGGTGGHIFPALAIAGRARQLDSTAGILFVGTENGIESRVVEPAGFALRTVDCSGYAGQPWWRKALVVAKLAIGVRQAWDIITEFKPDVVIGVGGYASLPVLLAARLRRVPVVLHEQNAIAGLANRVAALWAGRICVAMAQCCNDFGSRPVVLTGNPVRQDLFSCRPWQGRRPQLLVFGGSQGAKALNQAMLEALPYLAQRFPTLKIIHQSGRDQLADVVAGYNDLGFDQVEVLDFIDDMRHAYEQSQLVVCRSGATTVAELAACGRAAILVPFPQAAADHQTRNAEALVAAGAALLMPQREMTGISLAQTIGQLLDEPHKVHIMSQRARQLAAKGAADLVLNECHMLAKKRIK